MGAISQTICILLDAKYCISIQITLKFVFECRKDIVMRFKVLFRCFRNLGKLTNLLNLSYMINHLCHIGGRYVVTMIPGHIEMYWGSVLICATYMRMFWGITLGLAVCVWGVWHRFRQHWIPSGGIKAFWILAMEWVSCVWPVATGSPNMIKHTLKRTARVIILTPHTNTFRGTVGYKLCKSTHCGIVISFSLQIVVITGYCNDLEPSGSGQWIRIGHN